MGADEFVNMLVKELKKNGYSKRDGKRVWKLNDQKLWYVTPELVQRFLDLESFEPYNEHIIKPELSLIKDHTNKIIEDFGYTSFNLIDLGSGDGSKAETFIRSTPKEVNIRYCPVDTSKPLLKMSSDRIKKIRQGKVKEVKEFVTDFTNLDSIVGMLRTGDYPNNLCLLLGSTLSTFDINDFLYTLSNSMFPGDCLIIGNGIRKGKRFVSLPKYKSSFIDLWFSSIMHALDFKSEEISWDARFANGRVEGFYTVKNDKRVISNLGAIDFKKGDEVVVAFQYKYYPKELKKFCEMYFRCVRIAIDTTNEFALVTCIK